MKSPRCIPILSVSLCLLCPALKAATWYVDDDIAAPGAGTSWGVAFAKLQDALAAASSGDMILVAEGTYFPDEGGSSTNDDRNATFQLIDGVEIFGGFPDGGGASRNLANNRTILSGDIDGNDVDDPAGGNSYTVVTGSGTTSTAVLDGFYITAGLADAGSPDAFDGPTRAGAGNYNKGGSPTIRNCVFANNLAGFGGGVFNVSNFSPFSSSSPSLINCLFSGNKATFFGGGLNNREGCAPTVVNCTFSANSADSFGGGGAITNFGASQVVTNCLIWNNETFGSSAEEKSSINDGNSTSTYNYCLIQNMNPGGTNLDGTLPANDPLFVMPGDPFTAPSKGENYRFLLGSPALNAGDNTANSENKDLRSKTRIEGGTIDLGAYEGAAFLPDADGDGLSDDFELAHTTPASSTSLAPDSNDDGDPFTALEEFAFGLDPNIPNGNSDVFSTAIIDDGGEDYLSITWRFDSEAGLLVKVLPEQSDDLGASDAWSNDDTVPTGAPTNFSAARSVEPRSSQDRDFLRVRVEKR